MIASLSKLKVQRMRPPIRQVLALDAGSRRLKLLLAESDFGRLRVLKEEMLDLQAEGLVSAEELKAHLETSLKNWGNPPLALVLPQHISVSQVIDVPQVPESEVEKLIADETIKLSGLSESRMVYDFIRLETSASTRQQFWVTFCQEGEIRERIQRLPVDREDLCDVTTTANALIAAYRAAAPQASRAILVHMGAQTTVVVVLLAGQGAFATSFQMGGDFFTRALARARNSSEESAENLKRKEDLLNSPEALPEFRSAVDGWAAELKRQLSEWFQQNSSLTSQAASFDLVASGGGFEQPGLVAYLKSKAGLPFQPWPEGTEPDALVCGKGFEVAFGTALQALGYTAQPVSLLPEDCRLAWRKRLGRQYLEWASLGLVALCVLMLALGTWRKLSLITTKQALLATAQAGQEAVEANDELTADLVAEYEGLRPIFAAQQNTLDALKTLSLIEKTRSNRSYWYVLLADQQSYFSQPPALLSTNRPARTNLVGTIEPLRPAASAPRALPTAITNLALARPGFIVELCVPGEAESSRQVLSDLVNSLKQQRLFSKVDLLSDDLRRSLADPKVTLADRDYVLALDFAETDFLQPARWKKSTVSIPPRPPARRTARPSWESSETAADITQKFP
jgi:Tfp pilus assembly PilM family ATPase